MKRLLVRLWLPALAVGVWELVTRLQWLDPLFFPSPGLLMQTFWRLTRNGELEHHVGATLGRLGAAYVVGSATGVALGLILGSQPFWRQSAQGVLSGLYASPKLSFLPAFLVFFGIGNFSLLLPAAISCFVLMTMYSIDAARAVKPNYVDLARSCGADRRALFFRVYLPACLPNLFTGLRVGIGGALVIVVAAEMLGAPSGLGEFIWINGQTLAVDKMYAGIAACALLGVGTNYLFERLERSLAPWVR
ncbi:MAG: ABC transporter permease [Bryobacteraceae bacterium]|jgi:ABC-type nitrate/sulfonate/bicarbonate transport system permease component